MPRFRGDSDLHIVALIVGCLLCHQDVVLLCSVFLPVCDLLSVCFHLLKHTTNYIINFTSVIFVTSGDALSGSNLPYPYSRERVPLLVVQVFLDVEESVEEDVGQLAPLKVPQRDLTWAGGSKSLYSASQIQSSSFMVCKSLNYVWNSPCMSTKVCVGTWHSVCQVGSLSSNYEAIWSQYLKLLRRLKIAFMIHDCLIIHSSVSHFSDWLNHLWQDIKLLEIVYFAKRLKILKFIETRDVNQENFSDVWSRVFEIYDMKLLTANQNSQITNNWQNSLDLCKIFDCKKVRFYTIYGLQQQKPSHEWKSPFSKMQHKRWSSALCVYVATSLLQNSLA